MLQPEAALVAATATATTAAKQQLGAPPAAVESSRNRLEVAMNDRARVVVDNILTGALLASGSNGIAALADLIRTLIDRTKDKALNSWCARVS